MLVCNKSLYSTHPTQSILLFTVFYSPRCADTVHVLSFKKKKRRTDHGSGFANVFLTMMACIKQKMIVLVRRTWKITWYFTFLFCYWYFVLFFPAWSSCCHFIQNFNTNCQRRWLSKAKAGRAKEVRSIFLFLNSFLTS